MNHQSNNTQAIDKFTCPYCSYTTTSLRGLSQHCKRSHKIEGEILYKKLFPDIKAKCSNCQSTEVKFLGVATGYRELCKKCLKLKQARHGSVPWNKGLTKKTSERVRNASEHMKEHYRLHGHHRIGKTKETDKFLESMGEKISLKMKEHYKHNVHHRTGKTKENCVYVRDAGKKISKKLKGRKLSDNHKKKLSNIKTLNGDTVFDILIHHGFKLLGEYSHSQSKIIVECIKCGSQEEKTLHAIQYGSTCNTCYPPYINSVSAWQHDIYEFMKNLCPNDNVVLNTRDELDGLEIDVFNKTKNIGVECHGLYWHSDHAGKFHRYHSQLKDNIARQKGIKLIQIYEDEWSNKQEIVKSILAHKIKSTCKTFYARKLTVSVSTRASDIKKFFNENHLEGSGSNSYISAACLLHNGEIIAALTLKQGGWGKSKNILELSRFCTKRGVHVTGAFSRCLSHALVDVHDKGIKFHTIRTYIDKRIGDIESYTKNGFNITGNTRIRFWWTDFRVRLNRFKIRAKNGISEKEIAKQAKVHKIYGCENFILERKF